MNNIREREYILPESFIGISASALKSIDEPSQMAVMRTWFLQNYEKPEENTPYDSGEGGYIYIWGGPYDPKYELKKEFADIISGDTIDKLADEFTELSEEWSGKPGRGDLIDYFVQEIVDIEAYNNFQNAIREIAKLIEARVHPSVRLSFFGYYMRT